MDRKSKILIGFMVVIFVALPLISNSLVYGQESDENNLSARLRMIQMQLEMKRLQLAEQKFQQEKQRQTTQFYRNSVKTTITGTITAMDRNILIITDSDENRINVVLHGRWNIGLDVLSLPEVFATGYISTGDIVSIKVLKKSVTNENDVTVASIFGYEVEVNGQILYAFLPINIED